MRHVSFTSLSLLDAFYTHFHEREGEKKEKAVREVTEAALACGFIFSVVLLLAYGIYLPAAE